MRGDDYAVLGDGDAEIGYALRLYYKRHQLDLGRSRTHGSWRPHGCFWPATHCQHQNLAITGLAGSDSHMPAASL